MEKTFLVLFIFMASLLHAQGMDSSKKVSFIGLLPKMEFIVLAKVLYFPDSLTAENKLFPQQMQVQVLEVLKGDTSKKEILLLAGQDFKEVFYSMKPGNLFIFSVLKNNTVEKGFLEVKNNIVYGGINKEKSKEFLEKEKDLVRKYEKLLANVQKNRERIDKLIKGYIALLNTLTSSMPYAEFRKLLLANR